MARQNPAAMTRNLDQNGRIDDNVDRSERAKFEVPMDQWWNPEGDFGALHRINPLRLGFIDERTSLSGKKVCDIGCGGGILSEGMANLGAKVTGIDVSDKILNVARAHAQQHNVKIDYQCIAAHELAETARAQWDIVTCLEALEHVPDPCSLVGSCAKLVKPGGSVYFSTINRNFRSFAHAIVGAEYVLGLLPKGTHDYSKFIRPYELLKWCEQFSMHLYDMNGISYIPILDQYSLVKSTQVNYIAHVIPSESSF
ncbi:MAG: bifunctional 2-polyprenyl-6-hydroxyphenol methylase/3-demethylubiquinol 3-O-methyltransferase UbiG [Gammaproteobacteria bacterium]|nr:bifunctional 2-polyprenyl-6-hydroxyphenol methylase/3-demethylubiquinol 3-O-methyltransferase UbiG [Gammaproteobacteria bacterium]